MKYMVLLGLLCFYLNSNAQSGAVIFGGVQSMVNGVSSYTAPGEIHHGWHAGLKARFHDGRVYFSPGLCYVRSPILTNERQDVFNDFQSFHIIQVPANLGCKLRLSRLFALRLEIGLTMNYFQYIDDNTHAINYNSIYDLYFDSQAIIGLSYDWVEIDLKRQIGLTDAFQNSPNSTYNTWMLSFGFFF